MRRLHDHAQQLSAAEPRSAGSVGYWRWLGARGYPLVVLRSHARFTDLCIRGHYAFGLY